MAKYAGYVECASPARRGGQRDTVPVVVGATHERITIYSLSPPVRGVIPLRRCPLLVPAIVVLPF